MTPPPGGAVFPAPRPSWTLENSTFTGPCLIRFPSWPEIPSGKSPIISPDPESKPAISRPYYSTLIPRGIHRDRKRLDKPITHPSRKNEPVIPPRHEDHLDKKFL